MAEPDHGPGIGFGGGGGGGGSNTGPQLKQMGFTNVGPARLGGSVDSFGFPEIIPQGWSPGFPHEAIMSSMDGVKHTYNNNIDQQFQTYFDTNWNSNSGGNPYILYGNFGESPSPIINNISLKHFLDDQEGEPTNQLTPISHRRTTRPGGPLNNTPGILGFGNVFVPPDGPKVPHVGVGQATDVDKTPPYSISKIMGNVPTDPHIVANQGTKTGANSGGNEILFPADPTIKGGG